MSTQVEEIKQKANIVSVVQERVKLARSGRNFKAVCPFHNERTPSFMVSPELQIYKCFGCGKAGDVFDFLREYEGMEFPEALQHLAGRVGVTLQPFTKDRTYQRKEKLREIMHIASEYYSYVLTEHVVGKKALRYLTQRGIRQQSIVHFKLGYAADSWDAAYRYLRSKKGYSIEDLSSVGLVLSRGRRVYDRFRNRIIFPLRDVRGHVIGFAGRVLPGNDGERAKYINSPETELYSKSHHLYGLHEDRQAIKKRDQIVLVEGELDVISSWQVGVKQVVAVKGTALTREQVELVRRYTRNAVFALDADTAGDAATKRSIALADAAGLNVRICSLSGGKDPDEIARADPKAWRRIVDKATSVYDFYLTSARKRFDVSSGIGKKQASEEVIPILAGITNTIEQSHYIRKFAKMLDVSDATVTDEIQRYQRTSGIDQSVRQETQAIDEQEERSRFEILDEYLLSLLLQGGNTVFSLIAPDVLDFIQTAAVKRIVQTILKDTSKTFDAGVFLSSLPKELQAISQQAYLRDLDLSSEGGSIEREVKYVIAELKDITLRSRMLALSEQIKSFEDKSKRTKVERKKLATLRRDFDEVSRLLTE